MSEMTRFQKLVYVYRMYSFVYLLFAFNAFINGQIFMKAATALMAAGGAVILLWMLIENSKYRKMKNVSLLLIFLISYLFSSVMNYKYGIAENIQAFIWLVIQMGVLYAASYNYTSSMMKKELKSIAVISVIYTTVSSLISFSMIIWGYLYDYVDPAGGIHGIGYRWGRLWGVYDDPNHGAVIAVLSIILAVYLFKISQKKSGRVAVVISILIQWVYIGLANSRTAMVALAAGILVYSLVYVYSQEKKIAKALVGGIVVLAIFLSGCFVLQSVNEKVDAYEQSIVRTESTKKPTKTDREKDLAKDSSNGRMDIWMSGLEISRTTPVYGTSFRNMTEYAEENLPDTYIVNNSIVDYDSLHNMFVDVLVSQGIIGILITILLIANTLWVMWKSIPCLKTGDYEFLIICFSIIVAMAAASMFYSYLFYLNAPQTYIFWLCMGYLISIMQKSISGSEA